MFVLTWYIHDTLCAMHSFECQENFKNKKWSLVLMDVINDHKSGRIYYTYNGLFKAKFNCFKEEAHKVVLHHNIFMANVFVSSFIHSKNQMMILQYVSILF